MKISHDSETAAVGQQVITACALIHHDFNDVKKVFLPKRASTKKFLPDVYEIPGGHIDYNENIVDGLKREIKEELEIDIRIGDPFFVFDYCNPIKGSHSIEVIYFATLVGTPDEIVIHPEDHSVGTWFSEDDLENVYSNSKSKDDPEYEALRKAFKIMNGERINLATNN
jgi:8-oxo-dGTP pyrophosphatase MutT (NUDIX family)